MVGNDIVDLTITSPINWQRNGFLQKVFTPTEQHYILNSEKPFQLVWLLWSMKESAYKMYMQQGGKRMFAPQKFECFLEKADKGMVFVEHLIYQTKSKFTKKYIHTIAYKTQFEGITKLISFTDTSEKNQSKQTHMLLKEEIAKHKKIKLDSLTILKNKRDIPQLYYNNKRLKIPFSISHHGTYGAIVFCQI